MWNLTLTTAEMYRVLVPSSSADIVKPVKYRDGSQSDHLSGVSPPGLSSSFVQPASSRAEAKAIKTKTFFIGCLQMLYSSY